MKNKFHMIVYNVIAKIYDTFLSIYFNNDDTNPRNVVAKQIQEFDRNILEVCCGTCKTSIAIARENDKVDITAIDRSNSMLSVARSNIEKLKIININLKKMDATNMHIENNKFDVVILSLVLHEIDEELQHKILSEVHRVLKDDGKFIVVEWEHPKTIFKSLMFLFIKIIEPKTFKKLINEDMTDYFKKEKFYIDNIHHTDYTKVIILKKDI